MLRGAAASSRFFLQKGLLIWHHKQCTICIRLKQILFAERFTVFPHAGVKLPGRLKQILFAERFTLRHSVQSYVSLRLKQILFAERFTPIVQVNKSQQFVSLIASA